MKLEGAVCAQKNPRGYMCTEDPGHDGDHIAKGTTGKVIATWPATVASGRDNAKRKNIVITRLKGTGIAECENCDKLHPESTRERCRTHVQQTGHRVRFVIADTTIYESDSEDD